MLAFQQRLSKSWADIYDVYVNNTNDLLVVARETPIPSGMDGSWRKKRAARTVSVEIRSAVLVDGYFQRKLFVKSTRIHKT
jgi:hypothetical protein